MSKVVRAAAIAVVAAMAGCSGGGGRAGAARAAGPTTTSILPTTTSIAPTTTTLSQEDQVKAAYLAYWKMVDGLFANPGSDTSALSEMAAEPLLSEVKDDLATSAAQGSSITVPPGSTNRHSVGHVATSDTVASLDDCWVDGRVEQASDDSIVDGKTFTKTVKADLVSTNGMWRVTDVRVMQKSAGATSC